MLLFTRFVFRLWMYRQLSVYTFALVHTLLLHTSRLCLSIFCAVLCFCAFYSVCVFYRFCFDSHSLAVAATAHHTFHMFDGWFACYESFECVVRWSCSLFFLASDLGSWFVYLRAFSIALWSRKHAAVINFIFVICLGKKSNTTTHTIIL